MQYTEEECRKLIRSHEEERDASIDHIYPEVLIEMLRERLDPTDVECLGYFIQTAKELGSGFARREARMCEEAAYLFEERINGRKK